MLTRLRTVALVPVLLGAVVAVPLHAAAGDAPRPATIHDRRGDGSRGIDIRATTISSATQHRVLVETKLFNLGTQQLNASELWLDTVRTNPGPEFRVLSFRGHDGDGITDLKLLKVSDFRDGGTEKKCAALRVAYSAGDDVIRTYVPRACIGRPARLRYNAITWDFRKYVSGSPVSGFSDHSPKKGHFSKPWPRA